MKEDFDISEEDEKELDRQLDVVCSLEFYLTRTLPHAEQNLTQMLRSFQAGEVSESSSVPRAIISRSVSYHAKRGYPDNQSVQTFVERIEELYSKLRTYLPDLP